MPLARPGEQIADKDGNSYRIEAYLGEGVTAEVYKATRQDDVIVALKILRPNLPREIARNFRDEADILGRLAQYSQQIDPERPIRTPLLLGRTDVNAEPEFLVLEYIAGESLDDLIISTGGLASQNREEDALIIAQQVLQVLYILHQDIRRSYTDFQLKNIVWLADEKQIKVMDWNHVSDRAPEGKMPQGATGDLIRFGAFFYQLLTGKGALQTGETEGALAHRAEGEWKQISLSTQAVITKALHPNPERRYQTADTFLTDITNVLALWEKDLDDLYDEATGALRQIKNWDAQENDSRSALVYSQSVALASAYLDLYTRRSPDSRLAARLQDELVALTDNVSSQWGAGRKYYEAGIYSQANQLWEPEAVSLERLDLWRWVMLSRIGQQMGKEYKGRNGAKKSLEQCLTILAHKNIKPEEAKKYLQEAQNKGAGGDGFISLEAEIQAWLFFQNAQSLREEKQWQASGDAYKQTARALDQIKDVTYLRLLTTETDTTYPTLPASVVLLEEAESCYKNQTFNEDEGERVEVFRKKTVAAAASIQSGKRIEGGVPIPVQELDGERHHQLVHWLKMQLVREKNQPILLQAVVEEADRFAVTDAIDLLWVAKKFGLSILTVQTALQAKWMDWHVQNEKDVEARKRQHLEEETAEILTAIQKNEYATVHDYIERGEYVSLAIPPQISSTVKERFDAAIQVGEGQNFDEAQNWLTILESLLPENEFDACQIKLTTAIQMRFIETLGEESPDGLSAAEGYLMRLSAISSASAYSSLQTKLTDAKDRQKQREAEAETVEKQAVIEADIKFLLQKVRADIGDMKLNIAQKDCSKVRSKNISELRDGDRKKEYQDEANELIALINKLKRDERKVRKEITVEDYLVHLSGSEDKELGEDIRMKLTDVENFDKRMNRRFAIVMGVSLLAMALLGVVVIVLSQNRVKGVEIQLSEAETRIAAIVVTDTVTMTPAVTMTPQALATVAATPFSTLTPIPTVTPLDPTVTSSPTPLPPTPTATPIPEVTLPITTTWITATNMYDWPEFGLSLPVSWTFDLAGENFVRVIGQNEAGEPISGTLQLSYTDVLTPQQSMLLDIEQRQIFNIADLTQTSNISVTWAILTDTASPLAGDYQVSWILNTSSPILRSENPVDLNIRQTYSVTATRKYAELDWYGDFTDVDQFQIDIIGIELQQYQPHTLKYPTVANPFTVPTDNIVYRDGTDIELAAGTVITNTATYVYYLDPLDSRWRLHNESSNPPEYSVFLIGRLTGTREIVYVGDVDTFEYQADKVKWMEFVGMLLDVFEQQ